MQCETIQYKTNYKNTQHTYILPTADQMLMSTFTHTELTDVDNE